MWRKKYYRKSRKRKNDEINEIFAISFSIVLFWFFIYYNFILPNIENIKFYWLIFIVWILVILLLYILLKINKKKRRLKNIDNFILELYNEISLFKPLREYSSEEPYQLELAWFLKKTYNNLDIEITKWDTRPDIIIDNISIEIKWPTGKWELRTIPDKIMRYLKHWDYIIIILFNLNVDSKYYKDWKNDIYNTFSSNKNKIFIIDI